MSMAVASTRSRVNQIVQSWQSSVYTRNAADCVLICTVISSNLLIMAASAGNGLVPFQLIVLADAFQVS
jgi:hypothetical protein